MVHRSAEGLSRGSGTDSDNVATLLHDVLESIRQVPGFDKETFNCQGLLATDDVEAQLAGLEEYYCDYAAFIGWEAGLNLVNGKLMSHVGAGVRTGPSK